jgi:hypothetical protein
MVVTNCHHHVQLLIGRESRLRGTNLLLGSPSTGGQFCWNMMVRRWKTVGA